MKFKGIEKKKRHRSKLPSTSCSDQSLVFQAQVRKAMAGKKEIKQKLIKKASLSLHLPKINRFISERMLNIFLRVFFLFLALIITFILIKDIKSKIDRLQILSANRLILQKKLENWQNIAIKYPDFRDAYIKIAYFSYELQDFNTARIALDKARSIDPNSKIVKNILEKIKNQ